MEKNKIGLYIHIPFCEKKCDYCDFVSYGSDEEMQKEYLQAIIKEIEIRKYDYIGKVVDTIYIGGGTPSCVFDSFIISLMNNIYKNFKVEKNAEITIEVNPKNVNERKMTEYRFSGINRISMGVQCVDKDILSFIGRIQTMENIDNAFQVLKNSHFTNISVDIMIGLPFQTEAILKSTLDYLLKKDKNIKHISVYALQLEENTKLFQKMKNLQTLPDSNIFDDNQYFDLTKLQKDMMYENLPRTDITPIDEEKTAQLYDYALSRLIKAGFIRYEVSNFSKGGLISKHNMKYWKRTPYLGLGVAAHSYDGMYRFANTNDLQEYIDILKKKELPMIFKEYVTKDQSKTEYVMLAMRTELGLDLENYKSKFNEDLMVIKKQEINELIKNKALYIENGYLKICKDKFYISNYIITALV